MADERIPDVPGYHGQPGTVGGAASLFFVLCFTLGLLGEGPLREGHSGLPLGERIVIPHPKGAVP